MLSGFHSLDVMPVRVPAVALAVGAPAAEVGAAAAVVGAAAALVGAAAGGLVGAAACCELRVLHASINGMAARALPVAKPHFRNDRRLTPESCLSATRFTLSYLRTDGTARVVAYAKPERRHQADQDQGHQAATSVAHRLALADWERDGDQ